MKPSVEKGLASHSSIMVTPREFARGCEDGDGWIKVPSKKSLHKEKKIHKNKPSKDISFFSAENNKMKFLLQLTPTSQAHPDHPGHPF